MIKDFLRMVWELKLPAIVMVTGLEENGKVHVDYKRGTGII